MRRRTCCASVVAATLCIMLILAPSVSATSRATSRATSAWSIVPSGNEDGSNWLRAVSASSGTDAWAVGWYIPSNGGYDETLALHWDGAAWSVVDSPNGGQNGDQLYGTNQLYDVKAFAADDVWAAGWQWVQVGSAPLVDHWDGHSWKVSKVPSTGFRQTVALDGTSSSDLWAVGYGHTFNTGGDK